MAKDDLHTTGLSELSGNTRRQSGWRRLRGETQGADLEWIGRQLGRSYDHVSREPLPERFTLLLMQLDACGRRSR